MPFCSLNTLCTCTWNVRCYPLETCFACYRQLFHHGVGFTYDLADMAQRSLDFQQLARQWRAAWPDHVHDLDYDHLAREPEPVIRGLLAACGLPFDAHRLAPQETRRNVLSATSAAQVRQAIHPPRAYAAVYGAQLHGLAAKLRM